MSQEQNEEEPLRSVAQQDASSIFAARQRAEQDLVTARESLRESEQRLRAVFNQAAVGIAVAGLEGRFEQVNQRFIDIVAYSAEELLGLTFLEITHPDDREKSQEKARELLAGDVSEYAYEKRFVRKNGTSVCVVATVTLLRDAADRPHHYIGVIEDITERKREEEVRAHLAAVVESSDDAIITKTLKGIITTWNQGAEQIFGYRADEAIGKPITMLIPHERIDEETLIVERLMRGERIEHFETVRVRKDGTPLNISLSISPIKDGSGNLIGASKIARDITARRRMEEALRDETRVLELLNRTGTMIASQLDLQSLVQSVTDAGTQLSGAKYGAFFYNASDSRGESPLPYTLSGARREEFAQLGFPRDAQILEKTFRGQGVVRSPDITRDPDYGTMTPHPEMPGGQPPVRSYLALPVISRSEQVIGGLFFAHPDPGVFTERAERIMMGVAAQAAVAIDNARLYDRVKHAAHDREKLLEAERCARTEAERVSLLKDEFLANLSHELRTPLNAILGWSQILRSRDHADEELAEGLEVIERNTRVQAQLIEDLLDMSRIIAGKIRLDVQRVDLQDVVKAAVASVRHSADARGIRLNVVLDPLAGPVRGDPGRLQQCFWNLLSNAIKFTPRGGRVQVGLARLESHVEVCVVDDGQGIKPEFLPYMFERFRQGDASITRHHGGLGLGLSIVKNLVELHGGKIHAKSAGEGQGATFCVELPVMVVYSSPALPARDVPRPPPQAETTIDHPSLLGITVLAVDDEPDARNLVKRVLEECGAKVILAGSAREALGHLLENRPDIIISDVGMPGEDGYEFIRQVRALGPDRGGRTPAAALTAFARAEDRTRALRAGYQTHVAKPVEPAELTAMVASLAIRR